LSVVHGTNLDEMVALRDSLFHLHPRSSA
jgi:hypothetical protein